LEQAAAASTAVSLPDNLRAAPGHGASLKREFQIAFDAFDEASLDSINRRSADPHGARDRLVAGARVGRQKDLRSFEFARRVFAAAQQRGLAAPPRLVRPDAVWSSRALHDRGLPMNRTQRDSRQDFSAR